ncbi:exostosin family protein [Cytophagaceae bacterium YF14B1]|uniref:Exostosin family protein n=1 Tax=Xanthocytophaga flava TaxID=3048013 RepID=A0AAE3QSN4_9BACT|nr:exostosin family protein [Xanthocytophaga flavus]MDJ1484707.1 exostosin family protein [Xanthocytophaga flavus]
MTTFHHNSTTKPLDLWVSNELLSPNPSARPCPLLMHLSEADTSTQTLFWNPLRAVLPGLVRIHRFDTIEDAGNLVVIPHDAKEWMFQKKLGELRNYIRKVLATGRTVVTFAGGMEYKPQPGEIVFATSVYQYPGEKLLPIPTWIYDIGHLITPISKPATPTIAFDGNTKYSSTINKLTKPIPVPDAVIYKLALSRKLGRSLDIKYRFMIPRLLRQRVLKAVRAASNLKSHLVERDHFFVLAEEERVKARAEYLRSTQEHAYILCMRGDANGDFRTYEVLSAGRIPVIIDTKLQLPPLQGLKWEDFCVFVPLTKLDQIGEIVQQFHAKLTEETFQEKCQMARAAFDQLLPHNFIVHVINEIHTRVASTTNDIPVMAGAATTDTTYQRPGKK